MSFELNFTVTHAITPSRHDARCSSLDRWDSRRRLA